MHFGGELAAPQIRSLLARRITSASQGTSSSPGSPNRGRENDGILGKNSRATFGSITDGTSNTLMVGERDTFCGAGAWVGNRNPDGSGPRV